MSSKPADKVRISYYRADNTETESSPHTHAYTAPGSGAVPSTIYPDQPQFSNATVVSAVAGLPPSYFAEKQKHKSAAGSSGAPVKVEASPDGVPEGEEGTTTEGFPLSTRRVETLSFDMDKVSPPIANLFRRLILTDVPTLAFDRILIEENDGVVLDELLSHRLGLVPVAGPVSKMEFITEQNPVGFQNLDPTRVLLFELEAEGARDAASTCVYSRQLRWVPLAGQEAWVNTSVDDDKVFLVHPDILLTKLGPGQRLKLKAIAVKGIGAVHAKWSPVSSCYYEMKTSIDLQSPITGADAQTLVKACPMGVFALDKKGAAVVEDVSRCTLCRECLRQDAYPTIADRVRIEKDKTSVRFHLESTGQMHSAQIFRIALKSFAERCRALAQLITSTEVNVVDASAVPQQAH